MLKAAVTPKTQPMKLVWPAKAYLPSYVSALNRGWARDETRPESGSEERAAIKANADRFLVSLVDREAKGGRIVMPDGSKVRRLPGYKCWMWDGEFCGTIGFRWQPGTEALPPHCLGHIGYGVVPWKQRRGYAREALRQLLPHARAEGLRYVEITTDPENLASQRVIEANGGVLFERFTKPAQFGATPGLRYRIALG